MNSGPPEAWETDFTQLLSIAGRLISVALHSSKQSAEALARRSNVVALNAQAVFGFLVACAASSSAVERAAAANE
jgi:hypothetical protein